MNPQAGGHDPRVDRAGHPRRGLGSRRLVWGAFLVSAAFHVVFVLLYPSLFPVIDPRADFLPPLGTPVPDGIQVLRVIEIDEDEDVPEPDAPEFAPVTEREVTVVRPGTIDAPVTDFARPGISAAERLRPRVTDPRLWAPLPPEFSELTLEQREELALAGRLRDWYDSVQAAAAAESAMTDWTFTDGDGGRWGVADGQLFLGDYAIPVPVFAAPPGAARDAQWRYAEVARQGQSVAVQQTVRERMEAIRARRDAERARERAQGAQGADSTGTRR